MPQKTKSCPKVSVLMPAYNSEKYIGEAIESILNQTFTDFEFIIINDGSTDNTAKIVRKYAKKDKRIKFVDNKKNKGVTKTRNELLKLAKGEYIACMDSDDISLPTRFEKQIKYMNEHPECGVLGTWYEVFDKQNYISRFASKITILKLLHGCAVCNPSAMIRKSVIDRNNLEYNNNFNWCEDYEFWSRMIFFTEIHTLQSVLLKYRWHNTNISVEHAKKQDELANIVKQNIVNRLTDDKDQQRLLLSSLKPGFLLPKWSGRIICLFIPKRQIRHNFREKYVKD